MHGISRTYERKIWRLLRTFRPVFRLQRPASAYT